MSQAVPEIPVKELAERVEQLLCDACDKELRIATAESCTGGLLSSLLTDIAGVSHAFDRGFVTYSEQAKADQLGIALDLIEREGAVSQAVARAMAEGAIEHSEADLALAITGFAGPGKDDDEEGLVHFACAHRDGPTRHVERHFGAIGRDGVRARCMDMAVDMLRAAVTADAKQLDLT